MKVPIGWLKEFVDIKLPLKKLMWRMTEVGMTTESFENIGGDIVLDVEVTPNRPDWMSIYGIAREIAAITNSKLKNSSLKLKLEKPKNPLQIKIKPDYALIPRITSVAIKNVKVTASPEWLQKRILQVGLRPINNLVDITNYVLWIYGNSLHVFDYDKIQGQQMIVESAKGGEPFRSLDGIDYNLPKDAIIIKDANRVIDLIPLKGGENTAVSAQTKNVLLHSVICVPTKVRRVSQTLGLRSDSSAIAERGMDPNGTMTALKQALMLILKLAGGEIASEILDHKEKEFKPWKVDMSHHRLEKVLGIKISKKEVVETFLRLGLQISKNYSVTIPTFRNDLHLEEDLIEEVARIHGYNNFPKSLPKAATNTQQIPYYFDDSFQLDLKNCFCASGFNEVMTFSLYAKKLIIKSLLEIENHIKIANPVSLDYEYLRTSLMPNLVNATKINPSGNIKIYELSKTYKGTLGKTREPYFISAIDSKGNFKQMKGLIDYILLKLNIENYKVRETLIEKSIWHPAKSGVIESGNQTIASFGFIHPLVLQNFEIDKPIVGLEFDIEVLKQLSKKQIFQQIPAFPALIEDLTFTFPSKTKIGEVIRKIKLFDKTINEVELIDIFKNNYSLRITYLNRNKTLTERVVSVLRKKIIDHVKLEFGATFKD